MPRPSVAQIEAVLAGAPPFSFSGIVSRFTWERYRGTLADPTGADIAGGRYNAKGTPALYTSFKRRTALAEFTRAYKDTDPIPIACMVTIMLQLRAVVDLTRPRAIAALGTTKADLCGVRVPRVPFFAQGIGDALASAGYEGLVVWSAQDPTEKNLVIFPQNMPTNALTLYAVVAKR